MRWTLIWRATTTLLSLIGCIALGVWFSPGFLPVWMIALSVAAIAAAWWPLYKILYALSSRRLTEARKPGAMEQKRRFGALGRAARAAASRKSAVPCAVEREGSFSPTTFPPRRRFVRFDPDTAEPVYKLELAGEC